MFDEGDQEVFNHASESGSPAYSQLGRTISLEFKKRLQHVKRITTLCSRLLLNHECRRILEKFKKTGDLCCGQTLQ